jgi:hypothetical protein
MSVCIVPVYYIVACIQYASEDHLMQSRQTLARPQFEEPKRFEGPFPSCVTGLSSHSTSWRKRTSTRLELLPLQVGHLPGSGAYHRLV